MKEASDNREPVRRLLVLLGTITLSALVICILSIFAPICALTPTVSRDDVALVESPDGRFRAVLVETNGGATTSFGYLVYIEPIAFLGGRHQVANLYAARRSIQAYGANMVWVDAKTLRIEYLEARLAELDDPAPVVAGEPFSVQLKNGVNDKFAPPGGMLYNLRGRPHR